MKTKHIRTLIWISVIVLCCGGFSYSRPAAPEKISLADAIQKGLKNNFDIRIARQNVEISKNNNTWGMAGRYPSLNLGLNFNNSYKDQPSQTYPDLRDKFWQHTVTPTISLNWTLFNGFAINITKSKLAYLDQLSEGNAAVVVENTTQAIILAYYKVLLEQEKLGVVNEVKKLSRDRYDYILSRKDVGAATTYDALQTKIAWLNDKSNAMLQEINVRNAKRNLNLVLGEAAEKEFQLTDSFSVETHGYVLNDLLTKLKAGNKTLRNQYINQKILKKDIALQRSSLYPSVSLNSGINRVGLRLKYEDIPAINSASYDYYVNFSVSLNLFNGGKTKTAIANAKIQEKIGRLQIEEMEFSLSNFLSTTFELYNVRKDLYTLSEERVASAKLNMDISSEKFKSGAINSFNYRDVQLVYLNSAFNKLQAIYDLIDTHSELLRLTGGIVSER